MAKRDTGVGKIRTKRPYKTKKRLETKRVLLALIASKRKKKSKNK